MVSAHFYLIIYLLGIATRITLDWVNIIFNVNCLRNNLPNE